MEGVHNADSRNDHLLVFFRFAELDQTFVGSTFRARTQQIHKQEVVTPTNSQRSRVPQALNAPLMGSELPRSIAAQSLGA